MKSATILEWLYNAIATAIVGLLVKAIVSPVYRGLQRILITSWVWAIPRLLSFLYIRVSLRIALYLLILPAITKSKSLGDKLGRITVWMILMYGMRGTVYEAKYSEEGRKRLEELRAILSSNGY